MVSKIYESMEMVRLTRLYAIWLLSQSNLIRIAAVTPTKAPHKARDNHMELVQATAGQSNMAKDGQNLELDQASAGQYAR